MCGAAEEGEEADGPLGDRCPRAYDGPPQEAAMTLLQFMSDHPFLTFFIIATVCETVVQVVKAFRRGK